MKNQCNLNEGRESGGRKEPLCCKETGEKEQLLMNKVTPGPSGLNWKRGLEQGHFLCNYHTSVLYGFCSPPTLIHFVEIVLCFFADNLPEVRWVYGQEQKCFGNTLVFSAKAENVRQILNSEKEFHIHSDSYLHQEFWPCSQTIMRDMYPSTGIIRALACARNVYAVLADDGLSTYKPNSQQICLDVK